MKTIPVLLLTLIAAAAQAQSHELVALADDSRFAAGMLSDERHVKGAPFCAEALHETIQPLADGNRIVKRHSSRLCRDGEGRTRQEVERGGRKLVYLRDPAAREYWALDPEKKTARRLRSGGSGGGHGFEFESLADGAAWRDYAESMREWARSMADRMRSGESVPTPPAPPAPLAPAAPAVVRPAPVAVAPVAPVPPVPPVAPGREVEVQVLRLTDGEAPTPLPPAIRWSAQVHAPRGPGVVTPLPAREIEGVRASGERTTWTIPPGKLGNEKPIEIVREVWTAPELVLTIATRDFDPRSGEVNYRLSNLKRAEPDPALMKVPSDYSRNK
jgi:hypothetical protein